MQPADTPRPHRIDPAALTVHPVTADRWDDLVALFGPGGAHGGCWCAYWRLRMKDFRDTTSREHRALLEERVKDAGPPPGLLAYHGGDPVAWVSVEPRERFSALQHARVYRAIDDEPTWVVTCFFVRADHRRRGLMHPLLEEVKDHVREQGGRLIEAYPEDPAELDFEGYDGYMGVASAFERAGFEQVATLSNGRPVVRCQVG